MDNDKRLLPGDEAYGQSPTEQASAALGALHYRAYPGTYLPSQKEGFKPRVVLEQPKDEERWHPGFRLVQVSPNIHGARYVVELLRPDSMGVDQWVEANPDLAVYLLGNELARRVS